MLRSGERVRITAQLVEASSDRHLWAQAYERDLRDVLLLQHELAQTIAKQVQIKLSSEEQTRLVTARMIDAEALEVYLQGREQWNKWTEEGVRKSIEYFEQAVHKDSAYAQGWAGISDAYNLLYMFGYSPSEETSARFSRTISSSARRPTRAPIFVFGTVVILSTINQQTTRRPLPWLR